MDQCTLKIISRSRLKSEWIMKLADGQISESEDEHGELNSPDDSYLISLYKPGELYSRPTVMFSSFDIHLVACPPSIFMYGLRSTLIRKSSIHQEIAYVMNLEAIKWKCKEPWNILIIQLIRHRDMNKKHEVQRGRRRVGK